MNSANRLNPLLNPPNEYIDASKRLIQALDKTDFSVAYAFWHINVGFSANAACNKCWKFLIASEHWHTKKTELYMNVFNFLDNIPDDFRRYIEVSHPKFNEYKYYPDRIDIKSC